MRKQRQRIFVGCEGASERSYVKWLQDEFDRIGPFYFFDAIIAGGGDPLSVVQESIKALRLRERRHGPYSKRVVLLDSDKLGLVVDRDRQIANIAHRAKAEILFQVYDHEAILLRHFAGKHTARPPSGGASLKALKKVWPNYAKPADAMDLARRLDLDSFRAFLNQEPELSKFFTPLLDL